MLTLPASVRIYLANQELAGKVKSYRFVSKADALRIMRKTNPQFVNSISSNPLPARYDVTPMHAEDVKLIAAQQRMVDPDLAEFVDDDRGVGALRRFEEPLDQRRLARAEKPGDDRHRDAGAARTPLPPAER